MKKVFKYRIYPNKKQTTLLNRTLDECRWLYNHLLEQRKDTWGKKKKSISCFDQCNTFKQLKQNRPSLKNIHSQVLQNVATRLDLAFQSFFRRIKKGKKPGYPRFRGQDRYDSFTYPQFGFKIFEDKSVVELSKIGNVKIKYHRPIEGEFKTCTVKKTRTRKWFVTFSCEVNGLVIPQPINNKVGIDMGLESFATLSNGEKVENPRFFRKEEKALGKAQRKFSKAKKKTPEHRKFGKVICRIHERITNKRHNFVHQLSRNLVNRFDLVATEDLSINDMMKDNYRCLNKSIADAAWRMFLNCISYKAEWAGKKNPQVNPAYTSQTCSRCGHRQKMKLSDRTFECLCCNLVCDRDHNSSINILALGMQSLDLVLEAP